MGIVNFLQVLVANAIAHKSSSAAGIAAISAAAALPAAGENGTIMVPATLEEGLIQIALTLIGFALFYFNPKKTK